MHLGSLFTALASYLHAKANNGKWLLRIDDLDTFRNVPSAAKSIINSLEIYGLHWDDSILYQSDNIETYQSVITQLTEQALVFPCICTRKALSNNGFKVYPGTCLKIKNNPDKPHSLRIKSQNISISFHDELQNDQNHELAQQHGDFIVKRKDNIIAYQLAVVIDDHLQKISHVIRGYDLLDSTPKQIFLQQTLGYSTPAYCHVPIIIGPDGHKLSKQTFARAISNDSPEKTLFKLLGLLKQNPPSQLKKASVKELICWGIENWQVDQLKKTRAINKEIY